MGFFDWFKKDTKKEKAIIEAGACPNCWGKQEYEGKYIAYARDKQRDINNKDAYANKAFIQEFVTQHVDGIHLKRDGNKIVCAKCNKAYKA